MGKEGGCPGICAGIGRQRRCRGSAVWLGTGFGGATRIERLDCIHGGSGGFGAWNRMVAECIVAERIASSPMHGLACDVRSLPHGDGGLGRP